MSDAITIPYEKQDPSSPHRMCGAAALSMVYASFGKTVPQAEVWPKISKHNRFGSLTAASHLIAQDALGRGFSALAIQAKHPLQVLRLCRESGVRAILNHRLKNDEPTGHFSVLVDIDGENVVLHDPTFGPSRRVRHTELLELWRPRFLNAEIVGDVLIAITDQPASGSPCRLCGTVFPESVNCPGCGRPVPLQPSILLGCVTAGCAARLWNYICCPACDHTWSFAVETSRLKATADSQRDGSEPRLWDLNPLFAELDKFCARLMNVPGAAAHPDLARHVASIKATQEQLTLAHSEQLARNRVQAATLAQIQQKYRLEEEAMLKKIEEIKNPGPPLDGAALGQALFKDLGFLGEDKAPTKDGAPAAAPGKAQVDILDHPLVRKAIKKISKPSS